MFALYSVKFKKIKKNKQKKINTETDPNSTKHFPTIKIKLNRGNPPWKLKLCRIRNKMSKWNKNKTYLNIQNYNICVDCSHKWSNWTTVCMSAFKVQWNNHPVCAVTWLKTATVREYILPHSIPAYNKRDPTLHWTLSCLQNKLEGILRHIWDEDIQTWYHINNKKRSIFLTPGIVSPLESLCKSMFVSHHEIKSSQNFTGVNAKSEDCSRTH